MTVQSPPLSPPPLVGAAARRHDGDVFVSGRAVYVDDLHLPGMVHMGVVRGPHPHARVVGIDTTVLAGREEVLAILTGADASRLVRPIPHNSSPAGLGGREAEIPCLAVDRVRYVGEPVAAVAATTPADADAAVALLAAAVTYEPLPFVQEAEDALAPGAPLVQDGWDDNVLLSGSWSDGDYLAAERAAEHVLDDEIRIHRHGCAPIEPRGYVADWNGREERLELHASCQNPNQLAFQIAGSLGLAEDRIRVVMPRVGGSFGLKMHGYPEEILVCVLSRMLGRPVKWIESRAENLLIGAREHTVRFRAAAGADGRIRGLRAQVVTNSGAAAATPGWTMGFMGSMTLPGGYRVENCEVSYQIVVTNKAPWNGARGYGKELAHLVMERVVDQVAEASGLDPLEVRRRNWIRETDFPYATPSGFVMDSGHYHGLADSILDRFDYAAARVEQAALRAAGRCVGLGLGFEVCPEIVDIPGALISGFDTSTVRMDPNGHVTVLTGVTSPGGGNETGIAQIVAGELGVDISTVTVRQGDTELCPYGFGNLSGRGLVTGGGAALLAARDIATRLRTVAAAMLHAEPGQISLDAGMAVLSADKAVPIPDVARAVYTLGYVLALDIEPHLEATRTFRPGNIRHTPDDKGRIQLFSGYSNALHLSLVEVDVDTGRIDLRRHLVAHDCGTMVNPELVEGQVRGATAMGLGGILGEHMPYGPDGAPLADSFKTYLLPRATDLPRIEVLHQETPSPYHPLGAKGAGETGVGGAQAAVLNAVHDALRPLGVRPRALPLTPPNVLSAIRAGAR